MGRVAMGASVRGFETWAPERGSFRNAKDPLDRELFLAIPHLTAKYSIDSPASIPR